MNLFPKIVLPKSVKMKQQTIRSMAMYMKELADLVITAIMICICYKVHFELVALKHGVADAGGNSHHFGGHEVVDLAD